MRQLVYIFVLCGFFSWESWSQSLTEQEQLLREGRRLEECLDYQSAYPVYQRCLALDSTSVEAINAMARVSMNVGKTGEARLYFQKTLRQDSTNFYANYQLARLYAMEGNYPQAIKQYKWIQQQDTTQVNPLVYSQLADCFLKMDSLLAATACYYNAFMANREHVGVANGFVNCLLRLGDANIETAVQVCDTALKYNPGNRVLIKSKAMACFMHKSYDEADSLYQYLLQEGDSTFLNLKYAAASRYYAGRQLQSIPLLEKAYSRDTTDIETTLLLGAALGMTYDRKQAFRLFKQAEQLMQPAPAWVNLLLVSRGETLWRDGQEQEAILLFYQAWKKNPERLDYLYRIDAHLPNRGDGYKTDKERAQACFIKYKYVTEWIKTGKSLKGFQRYQPFFQYIYEEAFFQEKQEIRLLSPTGEQESVSTTAFKELMNLLEVYGGELGSDLE